MANIDKALTKLDKKDPEAEDAKVDAKLSKDLEDLCKHFLNNAGTFLALHCPGKAIPLTCSRTSKAKRKTSLGAHFPGSRARNS